MAATLVMLKAMLSNALLCLALISCASLPPVPPESSRAGWENIAVLPARYPPQSNFRSFAVGKKAGAAKGAATGTGMALITTGAFAAAGPLEAFVAPYLLVVSVPVATASGAMYGGNTAISEQDAAALNTYIEKNLATLQMSDTLAQVIISMAQQDANRQLTSLPNLGPDTPDSKPDLQALAQQGADSAMQVVVTSLGLTGGKQLSLYMVADVRVLRVTDSSTLYQRYFAYESDEYAAGKWGEHQAALMQAELQRAYTSLANSVVEQVFLLTKLPAESQSKSSNEPHGVLDIGGMRYAACGLAWVSPPHVYYPTISSDLKHRNWNRFPKVSSLLPTLAWENFPSSVDQKAAAKLDLPTIRNVRYDLRVWKLTSDMPPTLVVQRDGLPDTSYMLQQPLEPGSRYFWSVRARYELDGQLHSTKWGYFPVPGYLTGSAGSAVKPEVSLANVIGVVVGPVTLRDPCTLDFIPTANYYRFQTP